MLGGNRTAHLISLKGKRGPSELDAAGNPRSIDITLIRPFLDSLVGPPSSSKGWLEGHLAIGSALPSIPDPILSTVLVPRGCSCAAPVCFGVDVSAFSRRRGIRWKFGSPGGEGAGLPRILVRSFRSKSAPYCAHSV